MAICEKMDQIWILSADNADDADDGKMKTSDESQSSLVISVASVARVSDPDSESVKIGANLWTSFRKSLSQSRQEESRQESLRRIKSLVLYILSSCQNPD